MNLADQFLLRVLAGGPPLTVIEARGVQRWWEEERDGDEGLIAFLVRHDVLLNEALHVVEWMRRGLLTCTDGQNLFALNGVQRARTWLKAALEPFEATFRPAPESTQPKEGNLASTAHRPVLRPAAGPRPRSQQASPNSPQLLKTGSMLGKCLLTAEIGRGSTGIVFRAYHQALRLQVVVKVLHREAVENDPGLYEQFRVEGRLLAQLSHHHVVRVYDFDDSAEQPYLVLESIEGLTLGELIQQSGRLRWDRAARIVLQVAQGLEAAYKLDVVHRDVKPANILITRDGNAKLADLGLALIVGENPSAQASAPFGVDVMAGTVAYMAPEQAVASNQVDHRSDIYALGATLYHALTGQIPFGGATRAEVLLKHATEEPISPQVLVSDVDAAVLPILFKMLAKKPEDRFQTYADLIHALSQLHAKAGHSIAQPSASLAELALSSSPEASGRPRNFWRTLVARFKA